MSAPTTSLSVVVPAYDEAACIGESLATISRALESSAASCEIVVVDDGSSDDTRARAIRAAAMLPIPTRVLRCEQNRGKGGALKLGFAATRGERVLFTDADLSTPFEMVWDLLAALDSGADLAIGSRKRDGARVEVHQPWWREAMGKVFTLLVRVLVAEVSDATCGFKAFRGDVGRELFAALHVEDWSFDAELLHLAERRELRVVELPVIWRDQPGTKVRVLRDALASLRGLLRIRWYALRGAYGPRGTSQPLRAYPIEARVTSWSNPAALAQCAEPAAE
jgi:dolichyl-phosphate beta-glucosyltransferase